MRRQPAVATLLPIALAACIIGCFGSTGATQGRSARGPNWLGQGAIAYADFDDPERADLRDSHTDIEVIRVPERSAGQGLIGGCANTTGSTIALRSNRFSPHRPWTLSFWWALPRDLPIDGGFGMFSLTGKGYIGAFVRGKGEWCALQRPAGVLQVYYFGGIQNVNDIYDGDLAAHLALQGGAWHHTAAVFRMGAVVDMLTDGRRVARIATTGRPFAEGDAVRGLEAWPKSNRLCRYQGGIPVSGQNSLSVC